MIPLLKPMSHLFNNVLLVSQMLATLNSPPPTDCSYMHQVLNHLNRCSQKITRHLPVSLKSLKQFLVNDSLAIPSWCHKKLAMANSTLQPPAPFKQAR